MGKEVLKIPEGVVDKKAFLAYTKLAQSSVLTDKRTYETSDGILLNIASFPHILKKKIEHLPVKEQNKVMTLKDLFSRVNNKASALKRRAFGSHLGRVTKHGGILGARHAELIEYFGRMFTLDEMLKHVNTEWGIPVQRQALEKFRKENAGAIERKVEVFKSSYSDIRLGVKRSRLEELVWLYGSQKDKYKNTMSREDYKLLLTTLESIRKEAEGDRLTIDGKVDVNYEANIQIHLREEVFKTLNLKEIILGRVAARMNINPVKLIYSLNQSFYAKYSNVLGDFDESESGDKAFPSQMNYNFENINKYHHQRDMEAEDAVEVEEKQNKNDGVGAEVKKESIIEKLKRKSEAVKRSKTDLNADTDIANKKRT